MDHPGWKQILQIKQSKLLNDFRIRFPELNITGIALMLGSGEPDLQEISQKHKETEIAESEETELNSTIIAAEPVAAGIDVIDDEEFRETLKNLGQTIADREKKKKSASKTSTL
jgi:hypothetical protein